MAQPIYLKKSAVSGKVPTTTQLELGECAVNTYDGVLYTKKNDGVDSVVEIGSTTFTGDVTGVSSKGACKLTLTNPQQFLQVVTGTIATFSGTTIIANTTAPTITSGTQIWTQPITISSGTRVLLKSQVFVDVSTSGRFVSLCFFRGSTLIGICPMTVSTTGAPVTVSYMDYDNGLTPGTYTYSCRIGINASGTWYVNQSKAGATYGGTTSNSFSLSEII